MTNFVTVISNAIENRFRRIKVRRYGNDDLQTPTQSAPFGIDSAPYDGMKAIYAETNKKGKPVIIGYINRNLLAANGETRFFSLDSDGQLSQYIWLKADGTMELGGSSDNSVRYSPLNSGLQDLVTKINAELTKIQTGIAGVGGSYPKVDVSIDVTESKIDEIKTL